MATFRQISDILDKIGRSDRLDRLPTIVFDAVPKRKNGWDTFDLSVELIWDDCRPSSEKAREDVESMTKLLVTGHLVGKLIITEKHLLELRDAIRRCMEEFETCDLILSEGGDDGN